MEMIYLILIFMLLVSMDKMLYVNYLIMKNVLVFSFIFMWESKWELICFFGCMDMISFLLIILSIWMVMMMMVTSVKFDMKKYEKEYVILSLLMAMFLVLCFSAKSMFLFFIFFESVMIPMFYLIFMMGNQMERVKAGIYMLLYTLTGSLPFLGLIWMENYSWSVILNLGLSMNWMKESFFLMVLFFLIKLPMYGVHLWLPKAHVEAPVGGSMLLAGVLLKLGGYGIYRMMMMTGWEKIFFLSKFMIIFSLMGSVYISLMCMGQIDMKMLVAYSSVCHMSYVVGGFLSCLCLGMDGALLMMISHGICSSMLFFLTNLMYERFYSRNMMMMKGMNHLFPSLVLFWFLACIFNFGAPPSMNLMSELWLMMSMMKWSMMSMVGIMMIGFLSTFFSLYMYSFTQHGKLMLLMSVFQISLREYSVVFFHLFLMVIYVLKFELFVF